MDAIDPDELPLRIGREIETAHEPVGEVHLHHDPDLGHVEILYVAADPFPPADFWSGPGRGRLAPPGDAAAGGVPLRLTEDGAEIGDGHGPADAVLLPPVSLDGSDPASVREWARREAAAFAAWRRGEVYGVVRESLSLHPGSSGLPDVSARWGVLDLAGAERALREAVERREGELAAAAAPRP